MFKNQNDIHLTLKELMQLIENSKNHTVQIARRIQSDLDAIDEISANMLLLSSLKLNNALDEFFSRIYFGQQGKLLTFYQYLKGLEALELPHNVISWINELRVIRNEFVHSTDIQSTMKIVFSNPLKVMRFIILVENLVGFTLVYNFSHFTGLVA